MVKNQMALTHWPITRFAISGLFITGLHALVVWITVMHFNFSVPIANGLAFVVATLVSYAVNTIWSFSSKLNLENFNRFILVSILGLILTIGVASLFDHFEFHFAIGIVAVICTVTPVTFCVHNFWTYKVVA
jgi:putative flippase GtrA